MSSVMGLLMMVLAQASAPMGLQECLAEALSRHPDLAVAETGVQAARVGKKATRAGYLPTLSVQSSDGFAFTGRKEATTFSDPDFGVDDIPARAAETDDTHGFGLFLRQPLFDGLRYWNRPRRAEQAIRRAELDVAITREGVALSVIEAYYRQLGQRSALQVLEQAHALSLGQLEFAQERHRLGAASKVDVSRARLAVGEDRISIERQMVALAKAGLILGKAIGRGDAGVSAKEESEPAVLEPNSLAQRVAADHVHLERNRVAHKVAEFDVEIAAGSLWPLISGSASYTRSDPEFYKVYSRFDGLYHASLGLTISYPIFEGFATQTAIEAAEVQAERVRRERAQIQLQLDSALSTALAELRSLQKIQPVEEDNIRFAEDSLELARERYQVGEGTALEMRDAQLAVTRAKLARVQTRYDLQIALARYHQARGDLLASYLIEEQR